MSILHRVRDAPQPRKKVLVMKRRITKAEYLERGGTTNPNLFRTLQRGKWAYWRNE